MGASICIAKGNGKMRRHCHGRLHDLEVEAKMIRHFLLW
jgi:hypothetical protein